VTHGRSVARSDGVQLELAALRGRVAVQAELVAARATRDQLAAEFERLRVDNQRLRPRVGELAAQVEQLPRASKRQAAPFSKGTVVPRPDGRAARPARPTATTHAAQSPTPTGSAGSSTLGCLRPARTAAARSASSGWPASSNKTSPAAGDPDLPLRHPDWPLPAVPATGPAASPWADLAGVGCGRRPGRPARGRAGSVGVQGAGPAGGQGRPVARPARHHDHPWWGDPGAGTSGAALAADLRRLSRWRAGQPGRGPG
jgi:hypothetical protein